MQQCFPDHRFRYNIIYSVAGAVPSKTCRYAKARGVKVVCHVTSFFHLAYAEDYAQINADVAQIYAMANHIVYSSRHAKDAAPRYLGQSSAPYTIIYNAVDTNHFRPFDNKDSGRFNVLAAGIHMYRHRLEPLIRAMPLVQKRYPLARLVVAGRLVPGEGIMDCGEETIRGIISEVGLEGAVFLPEYTQEEAPQVYSQGDVLAHLKHMDWTANVLVEAMACGLAIVHPGNGAMTELVGDAGVSLGMPMDWDRIHIPEPGLVAEGVCKAYERRKELGERARETAVKKYDMRLWVESHRRLFEELLHQ